jgi:SnoaL-like domain
MSTTTTKFDLSELTDAIKARKSAPQLELYAPDATVTIIDRISQPGSPRVLHGREQIAPWIEDTCSRELTHEVRNAVRDERGAAFLLACQYPDGTRVACATVLEITGGLIAGQTVVQAWDEP